MKPHSVTPTLGGWMLLSFLSFLMLACTR
uniref:Uncharacterized protein n=1 Tax=Anguilla anguilla TaxID=7936 RepID=A0A0E9TVH0_ANGAN